MFLSTAAGGIFAIVVKTSPLPPLIAHELWAAISLTWNRTPADSVGFSEFASVIDINKAKLPQPNEVARWSGEQFAQALRHDQKSRDYNPHFRQLLHVGFKVAAALGDRYIDALRQNEDVVAKNVSENIFERHLRPIFMGK